MLSDDEGEATRAKLTAGEGKAAQQIKIVGCVVDNSFYDLPGEN